MFNSLSRYNSIGVPVPVKKKECDGVQGGFALLNGMLVEHLVFMENI